MTIINIKGNAEAIEAVCSAETPPEYNNTNAINACIMPQTTFFVFGGLISPPELSILRTKVAESADVMKNIINTTIVINDNNVPNGYCV